MYRRMVAGTAKVFSLVQLLALRKWAGVSASKILDAVTAAGIFEAAHRENRRRDRWAKRTRLNAQYHKHGLNGPRAIARRQRQIEAGRLQVSA
jgi:hypothetical protein